MARSDWTRRAVVTGLLSTAACRYILDRPGDRRVAGPAPGGGRGPFQHRTLRVEGKERNFLLHVPSQHEAGVSLPLLLLFHGHGGNGNTMLENPGTQGLVNRGVVVACPSALAGDWTLADVAFVEAIFDAMVTELGVKPKGYVIGFSDGGGLALQAGALTTRCRAIGTMGITMPRPFIQADPDARLPFTVQIIGEKDPHFEGADENYPWQEARRLAAKAAGATGEPGEPRVIKGRETDAEVYQWRDGYVWIRVTGPKATHRIYAKAEGDAIDGIEETAQLFAQAAGLALLPANG